MKDCSLTSHLSHSDAERSSALGSIRKVFVLYFGTKAGFVLLATFLIVFSAYATYSEQKYAAILKRNAVEVWFLAAEAANESGTNYNASKVFFAATLSNYLNRMEGRIPLKSLTYRDTPYDASKVLIPIQKDLASPSTSESEARSQIDSASVKLAHFAMLIQTNLDSIGKLTFKTNRYGLGPWDQETLDHSIRTFHLSLSAFTNASTEATAEQACMDSRLVTANVFTLWPEVSESILQSLINDFDVLYAGMTNLAVQTDVNNSERIEHYARNVQRRRGVVKKLLDRDCDQLEQLLQRAYSQAKLRL